MADFAAARLNMVDSQVRTQDVTDVRLHDVMGALDRETFVPADRTHLAYADMEVEYAPGRWLLKPRDVAKLLQALRPMPGERALAISAPYAAAVMQALGVLVVEVEAGGDMPTGEFDIVVCEGAVAVAPDGWRSKVATGGRLGLVERTGPVGKASLHVRTADGMGRRDLFDCFVPVLVGFEAQHSFAL